MTDCTCRTGDRGCKGSPGRAAPSAFTPAFSLESGDLTFGWKTEPTREGVHGWPLVVCTFSWNLTINSHNYVRLCFMSNIPSTTTPTTLLDKNESCASMQRLQSALRYLSWPICGSPTCAGPSEHHRFLCLMSRWKGLI